MHLKQAYLILSLIFISYKLPAQFQSRSFEPKTKDEIELVRLTKLMSSASEVGDSASCKKYIDDRFLATYSRCNETAMENLEIRQQ